MSGRDHVDYRELYPKPPTDNFVYCYWQLKSQKLINSFTYRVVSDGCIDVFFNRENPLENYVMGFCRKFTEFPLGKSFDYIGVRFLPSTFPLLFEVGAKVLSNQSQNLELVLPDLSDWIASNVKSHHSFEHIAESLNTVLRNLIYTKIISPDPRFQNSLKAIFQSKGYLNIEKDLNTGLSPRQLRRIFNYHIGTTPKAFSNVVRFQNLLSAQLSSENPKSDRLYLDLGFFDQAHFIKQFKSFYGVSPSRALR